VQCHAKGCATPTEFVIRMRFVASMFMPMGAVLVMMMFVTSFMFVTVLSDCLILGHLMVMEAEKTFNKKHQQESANHPEHRLLTGDLLPGMREHVQQADPEHDTCNKADGKLHPPMCQLQEDRDESAKQGRGDNQEGVENQGPGHDENSIRVIDNLLSS
tara:strand:+ start:17570 stop:18046 length:477 start_codon:yes stop_codon:yes gene_type:complete